MSSKDRQLDALRTIRWVAVAAKKRLEVLFKQQTAFMTTYNKSAGKKATGYAVSTTPSALKKAVSFEKDGSDGTGGNKGSSTSSMLSPAESVIRKHSTAETPSPAGQGGVQPFLQHRGSNPFPPMVPVTVTIGGRAFPVCQATGFQSPFDVLFKGCLGCGQTTHNVFKDCPLQNDPATKAEFFKNLHAHKPHYRLKWEARVQQRKALAAQQQVGATDISTRYGTTSMVIASNPTTPVLPPPPLNLPQPPSNPFYYGQTAPSAPNFGNHLGPGYYNHLVDLSHNYAPPFSNQQHGIPFAYPPHLSAPAPFPPTPPMSGPSPTPPALMQPSTQLYFTQQPAMQQPTYQQQGNQANGPFGYQPPQADGNSKKARLFVQKVKCHSQRPANVQALPPMPINIDNGFPNLSLELGPARGCVELTGLFDTCGSLNTGYLPFHVWIASQYPETVESLRFFNSDDPFEPIKLEGAVSDPADYDASRHGLLTAVIRYKTPYVTADGDSVSLSVALGTDVSTNTIFGLPTLSAFEFLVNMKTLTATSPTVNEAFQLTRSAGILGFPAGVSFDLEELRRQFEAAKIVTPGNHHALASSMIGEESPSLGVDDFSLGYLRRSISIPDRQVAE